MVPQRYLYLKYNPKDINENVNVLFIPLFGVKFLHPENGLWHFFFSFPSRKTNVYVIFSNVEYTNCIFDQVRSNFTYNRNIKT